MSNEVTERSNPGSKKVLSKNFDGPRIRVVEKFGELGQIRSKEGQARPKKVKRGQTRVK